MDELYVEQIVKRKANPFEGAIKTGIVIVALVLFGLGIVAMNALLMLLGFAAGFVGFYLILPRLNVEFEYLYISKELSVDKIYNKESRKKAGEWNLTNMELFVPVDSPRFDEYRNRQGNTVFDFTSGENDAEVYAMVINDKKLTVVYLEPGEELVKAVRSQFPRQTL